MSQHIYTIILKLNNEFLKWVYSHKLLNQQFDGSSLWNDNAEIETFNFGGLYGRQFKTVQEITSFNEAFDELLDSTHIDRKYKHPLFYFIIFLNEDNEEQSLTNNGFNRLVDYARFILDIFSNGQRHFESFAKNDAYQMIFDEATQEYLFAKKEIYASMPLDELVEYIPDNKHADDIIRYTRIRLENDELYIPPTMHLAMSSEDELRTFAEEVTENIRVPASIEYEVLTYTIKLMVDAHKRANTAFYQYLNSGNVTFNELQKVYNQYKKHQISQSQSLLKVAIMVSDYLKERKLITVKRQAADFIFKYLCLFKAFSIKTKETPPSDYLQLHRFYTSNNISSETVRMMLKDVGEI